MSDGATNTKSSSLRQRIAALGIGAAWLLGLRTVLLLIAGFLASSPLLQPLLGALVVDIAAGRAGIAWTTHAIPRGALARRLLRLFGITLSAALATVVISHFAGWADLRPGKADSVAFFSLIGVLAASIRDELLLRAIPLHFAAKAKVPERAAIVFAALLSPTAFLLTGASAPNVVLSLATGLFFAVAYTRYDGAWSAIVAHGAWALTVGPLTHGAPFQITWQKGELALDSAAAGPPAWVGAGLVLAATALLLRQKKLAAAEPASESSTDADKPRKKNRRKRKPATEPQAPQEEPAKEAEPANEAEPAKEAEPNAEDQRSIDT